MDIGIPGKAPWPVGSKERPAIVTAAAQGIGRATAITLARELQSLERIGAARRDLTQLCSLRMG